MSEKPKPQFTLQEKIAACKLFAKGQLPENDPRFEIIRMYRLDGPSGTDDLEKLRRIVRKMENPKYRIPKDK